MPDLPHIDAMTQSAITDEQARFFLDNGCLVIRNVVPAEELNALQRETGEWVRRAVEEQPADPDFSYKQHEMTHKRVPFRIEYIIDKCEAAKALLAHPFILRSVEKLQGRNFIPTWDSMVFKSEGQGVVVPWHRDAGEEQTLAPYPIFNVDFYLDESDMSNCLWAIPGSNRWSQEKAEETVRKLNEGGFKTEGAVPLKMNPGDVLLHNILLLHGSPAAQSKLRRVVYYEFRPIEVELKIGPHTPEYIPLKQKFLLSCLHKRAAAPYARNEQAFVYNPTPEHAAPKLAENEALPTYRYPHERYWRQAAGEAKWVPETPKS